MHEKGVDSQIHCFSGFSAWVDSFTDSHMNIGQEVTKVSTMSMGTKGLKPISFYCIETLDITIVLSICSLSIVYVLLES